jgi:single-strand DNA-binding protein
MKSDVNQVIFTGRLTRNPELRTTPSGVAVCDVHIAVNRYVKEQQYTTFVRITTWDQRAEFFGDPERGLRTGDFIYVQGSLVDDDYEREKGNPSTRTSGRLKVDNAQIKILRRAESKDESISE